MKFFELLKIVKDDLKFYGAGNFIRGVVVFFLNPSFRLLYNYRVGYYLSQKNNRLFTIVLLYLRYKQTTKRSCDLSYKAIIGKSISFPHPLSIVIGDGVIIGNQVKIWQGVTIGSHGKKDENLKYPTIESKVRIYSGATIIGNINIGMGATVGANSVVNKDVPEYKIAKGIPAKYE